jgi:parallel beta-helix repeat protein
VHLGERNTLRHVTVERSGLLGVESSYSDGLVVDGLKAVGNNTEHFNPAPVAGGVKICSARGVTVVNSLIADNEGPGLWFDESVYDTAAVTNDILRNTGDGLTYEISAKGFLVDNLVAGNGGMGVKLNDASDLTVWNNTVLDNTDRPIWLVQDSRRASNTGTAGHDPRQPLPDPTVTWLLGPVSMGNNLIGGRTTATCLLCVQDTALRRTPDEIGITPDGDVYSRSSATSPASTVTWPTGTGTTLTYASLDAFRTATGGEAAGGEFTGDPVVDTGFRLATAVAALETAIAQPMPDTIAARIGRPAEEERLGVTFEP